MENELLAHGSAVPIPYWDWTAPITELPAFFLDVTYYDSRSHSKQANPFFRSAEREESVVRSRKCRGLG